MEKTISVIFLLWSVVSGSSLSPTELTVEYLKQPQAVDSPNPRLGWILKSEPLEDGTIPKNQSQTSYQILVSSSAEQLSSAKADLWNSNKIKSDSTFNVRYQGKVLEPGQKVFWTVRIWDEKDRSSEYAEASTWENGFRETHWTAKWIGAPPNVQKKALVNLRPQDQKVVEAHDGLKPVLFFRKHTHVDNNEIKEVKLYVTARGMYKVFFNSQIATSTNQDQPKLNPGWTDYNQTIQYQVYDVTRYIHNRNVTIGAMVGTGWYSGYVGPSRKHSYYGNEEFLLLEAHFKYQNGTKFVITSDDTWKVTTGPVLYADILHGELFYEDRQLIDWMQPGFNDRNWKPVVTKPLNSSVKLVAEASPEVSMESIIFVESAWETSPGIWVYDFGRNFVGYVMIMLEDFSDNVTVQVRHAEMLNEDGTVYTENLRSARATDTYVLNDVFYRELYLALQPHFTFHGFRYIEVTGLPKIDLKQISGIRLGVKKIVTSTLITENNLVNKLHKNIIGSQVSNLISVPTDCPQRDERLGWMADAQIFAPTAMYNGDVAAFYTKWMRDVREAQSSSGGFSDISPRLVERSDGSPAWGDAGVVITWHMYRMYGDLQIIEDNYNAMEKWLGYIGSSNPTLIWENKLNHNYGDWLSVNASTPKEVVSTAYYAYDALLMSQMANAIGKTLDVIKYRTLHENIAKAFTRQFVHQPSAIISGNTQTNYVLALAFRLLPPQLIPRAVKLLVENIKAHNWHLTTGFIGTAYLLPVLSENGHSDIAYKLLLQDTYPSWGFTIKNNATTMWERWDGWSKEKGFQDPKMNSFNHYAFGSVGRWMFQYMAGIDTDEQEVGFKKIIIRPHIAPGINRTKATYHSIRGVIKSSWKVHDKNFTLAITIPPNTQATVTLPFLNGEWERHVNSGNYEFNVQLN